MLKNNIYLYKRDTEEGNKEDVPTVDFILLGSGCLLFLITS